MVLSIILITPFDASISVTSTFHHLSSLRFLAPLFLLTSRKLYEGMIRRCEYCEGTLAFDVSAKSAASNAETNVVNLPSSAAISTILQGVFFPLLDFDMEQIGEHPIAILFYEKESFSIPIVCGFA
jgi:hypothetical protein